MTARTAVAVAAAAIAVAPATASAKELSKLSVCGASGCTTADKHQISEGAFDAGARDGPPSAGTPFYRVKAYYREPNADGKGHAKTFLGFSVLYVPRGHLLRVLDGPHLFKWVVLGEPEASQFARISRGVRPFPAARLPLPEPPRVPAAPPAPVAAGDHGSSFPTWAIAALIAAALAAAAAVPLRRRFGPAH